MTIPDLWDACGWLSPDGRYHNVGWSQHDGYMEDEIGMSTENAEAIGWIHLSDGEYSHYGTGLCSRLTPEQRRWLVRVGFDLYKGDEE